MQSNAHDPPPVLRLYLELRQYPILAQRIREEMRREMFIRGVINPQVFDEEVRKKAIQSQRREGLFDPYAEESADLWQMRTDQIREHLTDFYFAYNLPHELFEEIVQKIIAQRLPHQEVILSFNPELAPHEMLFAQGAAYEDFAAPKREQVKHHLREIIVVLIKSMISDQLAFVRVAREYFSVQDLKQIRAHLIGSGKIGGKAAGMLLAHKILQHHGAAHGIDVLRDVKIPESYFLGSDVYSDFKAKNDLFRFMNQKYRSHDQMLDDYPHILRAYVAGDLPEYTQHALQQLLDWAQGEPLIVRSSSLLEDNFGASFTGKYDSFFLPNQATVEENRRALAHAIKKIYASVLRPDALIYREKVGLTDYDERMAILIQKVEGQRRGRYFYPALAGVGFSHNPYRWSPRIRREDGLLRLVTGLGTRAVEHIGNDYPRLVALSHPTLRPEGTPQELRYYSQHAMDVIDLEDNACVTLPVKDVLDHEHPALNAIISIDHGDYVQPPSSLAGNFEPRQMVITFDRLLAQPPFAQLMQQALHVLEEAYGGPVDIEFAGDVQSMHPHMRLQMSILQCRTLRRHQNDQRFEIPTNIPVEDILFSANRHVPQGSVKGIRYVIYVDPAAYMRILEPHQRLEVGRVVGRLNEALAQESFIIMGPGRWGTSNIQLGVKVTYADIHNSKMLIEIAVETGGGMPEVSHGTHFFQGLVEANIHPLPLYPGDPSITFRSEFFRDSVNCLAELLPADAALAPTLKVIDVPRAQNGRTLTVVMNGEKDQCLAYLA